MKRIDESDYLFVHLPRVRLYRHDVESIFDIIKNANLSLTIGDSAFTYDSLDELKTEKGSKITQLEIKGSQTGDYAVGGITLKLSNRKEAYLSMHGRTPVLETCWYRLRDLMAARRRWYQNLLNPWTAWLFVIAAGILGAILNATTSLRLDVANLISYGFAFTFWLCTFYWTRNYSVVLLDRHHEHETFWKRNGDKVILLVAGALIGAVATSVLKAFASS